MREGFTCNRWDIDLINSMAQHISSQTIEKLRFKVHRQAKDMLVTEVVENCENVVSNSSIRTQ